MYKYNIGRNDKGWVAWFWVTDSSGKGRICHDLFIQGNEHATARDIAVLAKEKMDNLNCK